MMSEKVYPKVVVVRKGLIGVVVLITTIIICIILINLYKASRINPSNEREFHQEVRQVASNNDMNWYQNKIINQPVMQQNVENKVHVQSVKTEKLLYSKAPSQVEEINTQDKEAVIKAMSAPITSNQITSDQHLSTPSEMPSMMTTAQTAPSTTEPDQNMQAEKISFRDSNNQINDSDYLGASLKNPISPYELQAGTIIPGMTITGINSDLPGQITGHVSSNVYDSISGRYLLIPQGSKLVGLYDSQIAYGQERVLVVWNRIIFPNGQSIDLEGMTGVDMSGYAGFNDQVNNHYSKIFGSVVLMSVLGAGAQLSQPQNSGNSFAAPSVGQTMAQSLGTNLSNTASMITSKNINVQPTLEIRQGYEFNISVKKDLVFPGPYKG